MKVVLCALGIWKVVETGILATKQSEGEPIVRGVDWQKQGCGRIGQNPPNYYRLGISSSNECYLSKTSFGYLEK